MTSRQPSRLSQRVDRVCAVRSDAKTLRLRVLDEIRQVVEFDSFAWLLTDPSTAVGCDPLADVPCLRELPRLIKFKYLTDVNRWTVLSVDGTAARSLRQRTAGDLSLSRVWREVLAGYDITDVASVVFADRFGCWGFLDLWRGRGWDPFAQVELDFLSGVAPRLTNALRTRQAMTFEEPAVSQRHELGPVVLLLDDDLNVVTQTAATQEWLDTLIPPGPDRPAIPASAYNAAGQLLANEGEVDPHEPYARVHLAKGFWVTLRAARLGDADATGHATIAVTLEETSPLDRLDVFVRSFGLSPRECELMNLLATGSDTRDLAGRMFLSELTVQDHLKSIFAKTASRSRNTLLSKALGARPGRS
jgi:DNA-binding CsgD family transcriptional regulator